MFILSLSFIALFGAVLEGFICASQGHLSREQMTRFSRRFFRIPAKWRETPSRPWLCSPMPNFAPINPLGGAHRLVNLMFN